MIKSSETISRELVDKVKKYIDKYVDIPTINELEEIMPMIDLHRATNDHLREYLETYGSYKASLESKLAIIESNFSIIKSLYDNRLERQMDTISKKQEKRMTKDFARGRAINEDDDLQNLSEEIILLNAIFIRVRGIKDSYSTAYNMVSRMVSLAENSKEKTF